MGGGAEAICVHIGIHMTNMLVNAITYVMSGQYKVHCFLFVASKHADITGV